MRVYLRWPKGIVAWLEPSTRSSRSPQIFAANRQWSYAERWHAAISPLALGRRRCSQCWRSILCSRSDLCWPLVACTFWSQVEMRNHHRGLWPILLGNDPHQQVLVLREVRTSSRLSWWAGSTLWSGTSGVERRAMRIIDQSWIQVDTYLEACTPVVGEVGFGSEALTKLGGRYLGQLQVLIVCSLLGIDELGTHC